MGTLTITAKRQVTLRKDLLEHLGVHPGEKITVDKLSDGRIEVKAARPIGKISEIFNSLKKRMVHLCLSRRSTKSRRKVGPESGENHS